MPPGDAEDAGKDDATPSQQGIDRHPTRHPHHHHHHHHRHRHRHHCYCLSDGVFAGMPSSVTGATADVIALQSQVFKSKIFDGDWLLMVDNDQIKRIMP